MNAPQKRMVQAFLALHPGDAAEEMDGQPPDEVAKLLATESPDSAARVLRYLEPDVAAEVLVAAGPSNAYALVSALDLAVVANLLGRLQAETRAELLNGFPTTISKEVEAILTYPLGTAGRLMDARVALFRTNTTVETALERIQRLRDRRISDLVLTKEDGSYAGVVRLQDVVGADPEEQLAEIATPGAVFVNPMTPREDVVEVITKLHLASLPVVDLENRPVGIIRQAALVEAAQEDAITDLQQMVGGSSEERALSGPWIGVKSRLPWLNINLATAFLAASVVGLFEDTIARFTALAVLLPVVAGQSGNTGAQALAVTMRGLALREIRISHAPRIVSKEVFVGMINGIAIALVTSAGVYLWSRSVGLVLVMFLAMLFSMIAASAAGAMIPVALVKLNRDPATASSIILTTVTDIVGFFAFLGLATVFAGMLTPG